MNRGELIKLLRENVTFKLKRGKTREAVDVLEYLHKYDVFHNVFKRNFPSKHFAIY